MTPGVLKLALRSILFYRKPVIYQVLIIALLSAVITGSLLTGYSVKSSLKRSASEHLGNTSILISSGVRFFNPELLVRMKKESDVRLAAILEISGYSQSLSSQKSASKTNIYAVSDDFFAFQGIDGVEIMQGEIAVNQKLAEYLGVKEGDELIVRYNPISDIPADAPFAPAKGLNNSFVMRIGKILLPTEGGNFSLAISQLVPMNIFINLNDFANVTGSKNKLNRMLIGSAKENSVTDIYTRLKNIIRPSDIGLTIRRIQKTGQSELISDRVFIDDPIIKSIQNIFPQAAPVLTYLGNTISHGENSTPYSFISALPSSLYPETPGDNGIVVNKWLADDLSVTSGDTITMYWYSPDSLNKLIQKNSSFKIERIVDMGSLWADSLLMPDFPGISGSESCSEWDAGVPIQMGAIRDKDEDYWNRYKGTPKAFINYNKGTELWGNNYGPATSVRFPSDVSFEDISSKLTGSFDPYLSGFTISDILNDSISAANKSVDFSTLFLSLGFFLLLAALVLLSFAVSSYFDTKSDQIKVFHALGFTKGWIHKLFLYETIIVAFLGSIIGAIAGYYVNVIITGALNSVWKGAVQTDTLKIFFSLSSVFTGFIVTFLTVTIIMVIKVKRFIKKLNLKEESQPEIHSSRRNLLFLLITSFSAIILFVSSFFVENETSLSFVSGSLLFISLILFWRQYYIGKKSTLLNRKNMPPSLSRLYYSFYPSRGITPIIFIAAGLFSVFITSANRKSFDSTHLERSGGTGGYLLWCETAVPIMSDLNSEIGKKELGLNEEPLNNITFLMAKRSSGDDASCLNLNHITAPPLLGIDPEQFITRGSFSFSKVIKGNDFENPWKFLDIPSRNNTIYGIADQTVLQWGLMIKPGDTLIVRAENGQPLNIIIAGGLNSSVFQGNVLVGIENFARYYPSVSGSSVILADGDPRMADEYILNLNDRLQNYGISSEKTVDRLKAFYEVTNTYLSVFLVFGALGLIIGIGGLGFVLLRNYNHRKREFALMLATGFNIARIRRIIFSEQILILFAGVGTGLLSAIVSTYPSLKSSSDIPWLLLAMMTLLILITGLLVLTFSVRSVKADNLTESLKKE